MYGGRKSSNELYQPMCAIAHSRRALRPRARLLQCNAQLIERISAHASMQSVRAQAPCIWIASRHVAQCHEAIVDERYEQRCAAPVRARVRAHSVERAARTHINTITTTIGMRKISVHAMTFSNDVAYASVNDLSFVRTIESCLPIACK